MYYDNIEERIMLVKCGDVSAFEELVLEGCGSLYLYAAVLRDTKKERFDLVRSTYLHAWDRLTMLEMPEKYDVWIKGILWQEAAAEYDEDEVAVEHVAHDRVSRIMREAFRYAENYWYLSPEDKARLTSSVISEICKQEELKSN